MKLMIGAWNLRWQEPGRETPPATAAGIPNMPSCGLKRHGGESQRLPVLCRCPLHGFDETQAQILIALISEALT